MFCYPFGVKALVMTPPLDQRGNNCCSNNVRRLRVPHISLHLGLRCDSGAEDSDLVPVESLHARFRKRSPSSLLLGIEAKAILERAYRFIDTALPSKRVAEEKIC